VANVELNGTDGISGIGLDWVGGDVRRILGAALDGRELTVEEGIRLTEVSGRELHALTLVADEMRRRQAGDVVTYVVNRNINFTNVCIKHCTFCAFSRDHREEEGYFLPIEEIVRRAEEAAEMGATEVCIQAGLPPKLDGRYYIDLTRAIKAAVPEMHLHAFSPEEILTGRRARAADPRLLKALRRPGSGRSQHLCGDLDRSPRSHRPRRITVDQWIEVITAAHALGIRTTSTIMYGHVETPAHWIRHMDLLRSIQRQTGGFTEFVPLSLIHHEAPMYRRGLVPGVRQGATGVEVIKMHALARLVLGPTFRNIQSSWVKEGPKGTSTSSRRAPTMSAARSSTNPSPRRQARATAAHAPAELRRLIRGRARPPVAARCMTARSATAADERTRRSPRHGAARFGSYRALSASSQFRFVHPEKTEAPSRS
jgi:FO synthase subunit 2